VRQPKPAGRRRRGFVFILFGTVGTATGLAIDEVLESPDIP
jgi:hypothetical protein